jgi:hypothetical protein
MTKKHLILNSWMGFPWSAIATVFVLTLVFAQPATAADLGERVVAYCQSHVGQKVGNGQCAGLAAQALKAAGAEARGGADSPEKGDYVWGRQILLVEAGADGAKFTGNRDDIRPGDIIQYHGTVFGKGHYRHHTSVVREVDGDAVKIYQQHVNQTEIVEEGAVRLDTLKEGWVRIYRPLPKRG